jgi:tetratricopeptide (TPR) repeat protein
VNPVSALYWGLSGLIKLNSRQEEAALADFDRSLELNPTEVSALRCRAICLRRLGRDAESEAVLKTALSQDPEDSWLHSELAFSTLEKGKAGHSVDHFYEALRLSPESNLAGAGLTEALRRTNPFYRLAGWVLTVEERLTETRPVLKFFISLIIVGGLHYVLRESWPVAAYSLSLIYVAALFVRTYGHLPGNLALLGEGRTRHLLERKQVWLTLYGCSLATLFGLALVDAIVFQDAMWLAAAGWSLLLILLVTHVMGRRETIFHRVSFLAVAFLGSGAAGSLLLARDPGAILAVNGPRLGLIALWLGYIVTRRRAGNS